MCGPTARPSWCWASERALARASVYLPRRYRPAPGPIWLGSWTARAAKLAGYINGSPDGTVKIPAAFDGPLDVEGHDLKIPGASKPFTGLFDDLWIYHRELTDAQVKEKWEQEREHRTSVAFRPVERGSAGD